MTQFERTRLLVRLLVIVPLLWTVSPWHVIDHRSSVQDPEIYHGNGDSTILVHVDGHKTTSEKADHGGSLMLDGVQDCDSGPCAAVVDTQIRSARQPLASLETDNRRRGPATLVPPLIKPPIAPSMRG
jgi:hypothetical protein